MPDSFTLAPVRPFLDWPIITDPDGWADAEVALIGLPHSEPYPHDPFPNDQSRAPNAIRALSHQISDGPDHWDFDLGAPLGETAPRCIDGGNVPFEGGPYDHHAARVTALAARLIAQGTQLFVLGGDHGVTIPVIDALEAARQPIHIVHVDAHLDWRPEVAGVRRGYSSPLYWASRRPWIAGMVQIGLRGTGSARRAEVEAAHAWGSRLVTAAEVHARGLEQAIAGIPENSPVYVTIDADGIDPAEMPGVMAPSPGGVAMRQLLPLLRILGRRNRVIGLDIVEIAPSFDFTNGLSCINAGRMIVNMLGASWQADGAFRRAA
ncbi:arginase family protein [Flavisphingomonas formosensis]|uniref:arginase family protein n=1 Tax=Flavisphingomonas formosensis TaxID=861534 RepID=UPI0012FC11CC|nr:arginase family protein [Sphingomonas formosensis]